MGRPAGRKNKTLTHSEALKMVTSTCDKSPNHAAADSLMGVFGYKRANSCANCRHYESRAQECHAHAPYPRMVPGDASQAGESALWPIVGAADWCGDWVGKNTEVETK